MTTPPPKIDEDTRIVFAPDHAIAELQPYVDKIIAVVKEVCHIKSVMVSDQSWLSDFNALAPSEELNQALRERLGLAIDIDNRDDNVIVKLAYKLKMKDRPAS